jgi:uncharacterized RDD family membrane protein YckC
MRCPACGAFYEERSARCPECGAIQEESPVEPSRQTQPEQIGIVEETVSPKIMQKRRATTSGNPSLIEFPGVHRSAKPQWRKELGERVREVQERRARESILEAGGTEPLFCELEPHTARMLELLPQTEPAPPNPLVVAALRRIERAHSQPTINAAVATAMVYEEEAELGLDLAPADDATTATNKPERIHNLAVVPTPPVMTTDIPQTPLKPRRVICDQNDPALNYLDSIPTSLTVEIREYRSAPIYLRMLGAFVDLLFVCFLSAPFLALTRLTNLEWRNPRVIGFAAGTFLVVGFLYLTVSIAFTGRTIGMKLFSLRVVDARTGLIPTGSQSAGRALVYMLSLASAGIAFMYAFVDREKYAAHDRFTRTAVIRL